MIERAELFSQKRSMQEIPSFHRFLASEKAKKGRVYNDNDLLRRRLELVAASGPKKIR